MALLERAEATRRAEQREGVPVLVACAHRAETQLVALSILAGAVLRHDWSGSSVCHFHVGHAVLADGWQLQILLTRGVNPASMQYKI